MKLNCLIVEDDAVHQLIIEKFIKKDYQRLNLTATVDSAEAAQDFLSEHPVDLIFLDLGLPGMGGFEFIKSLNGQKDLQIILVTGDNERALEAFEYDVADYLVKPLSRERFDEAVSRAMRSTSKNLKTTNPGNIIFKKVARYMHSRNLATLEPVPLRFAKMGYAYPMLSASFDFEREKKALDIMEEAEKDGLLRSDFIDSFYVCNTCYNSHLHLREGCPQCKSTNLESEDLVHHFSCAYMGPISDFYKKGTDHDSSMICPKCEKTLKHIGVDYDKPSMIYDCKENEHNFQNPEIRAKCHSCGADTKVEYLIKKDIKKYKLTQTGVQVAEGKFEVSLNGFGPLDDIMDASYFLHFLGKAIERKKENGEEACIAEMQFDNIAELYGQIGEERTNELVRELYQIIMQEMSVRDEVIFQNKETAWFLFTEKTVDQSKERLNAMASVLYELIHDNFDEFTLEISMQILPVDVNEGAEKQLQAFGSEKISVKK
jgi:CheY-like chemotaxis protein/regulator of replication initiation timing